MDNLTSDDARRNIASLEKTLEAHGIHPYSVASATCKGLSILEMAPPIYRADYVSVVTDIGSQTKPAATYKLDELHSWEDDSMLALRCGLVDSLSTGQKKAVAAWQWDKPAQWKAERAAWRADKTVQVPAVQRDEEQRLFGAHETLKRKWEDMNTHLRRAGALLAESADVDSSDGDDEEEDIDATSPTKKVKRMQFIPASPTQHSAEGGRLAAALPLDQPCSVHYE